MTEPTCYDRAMARIRVEPSGIEFEAGPRETVMEAAFARGVFWPHGCDALGQCTNCALEIVSGLGRVSPLTRTERYNLLRQRGPRAVENPRLRLACQLYAFGDIVVRKLGVGLDTI